MIGFKKEKEQKRKRTLFIIFFFFFLLFFFSSCSSPAAARALPQPRCHHHLSTNAANRAPPRLRQSRCNTISTSSPTPQILTTSLRQISRSYLFADTSPSKPQPSTPTSVVFTCNLASSPTSLSRHPGYHQASSPPSQILLFIVALSPPPSRCRCHTTVAISSSPHHLHRDCNSQIRYDSSLSCQTREET